MRMARIDAIKPFEQPSLERLEGSRALSACERHFGANDAMGYAVAMGLTPDEAEALGMSPGGSSSSSESAE